jgi:conjugative relaxase-like TrwC/TraI family protein
MSLHRLSAGAGVAYLLRHTCAGDAERTAGQPLSAYYLASGYPPGRWIGAGLAGLADGNGVPTESLVDEQGMNRLYGQGIDPVTGAALGRRFPTYPPQGDRPRPGAVSGFDLTFTVPKSVSVLWALADGKTQARIARAHAAAVHDALAILQRDALFTRIGVHGCGQVATRGAIAAAFDHWDTRTGDPNLHTHVVLANKVQGPDGRWRTVDSKALYAAVVTISELYDDLVADKVAVAVGARWGLRPRGERRNPGFEIDGIEDRLLAEFSTRSRQVDECLQRLLADFRNRRLREPSRTEILQLRQQATRLSRPIKRLRPLPELLAHWRARAERVLPEPIASVLARVTHPRGAAHGREVADPVPVERLAREVVAAVSERRSTWTRWNLIAEAARATRSIRCTSSEQRDQLITRIADTALRSRCVALDPPEPLQVPDSFRRPDGVSVFVRHRGQRYTTLALLDAEQRLLTATHTSDAPHIPDEILTATLSSGRRLTADQAAAVTAIATSGRRLDVLVGPAGTGKTTTLATLRAAWETWHGPGSVLGLAPSATAARELADALGIGCENTAKWLHETELRAAGKTEPPAGTPGATTTARPGKAQPDPGRWQMRAGQLVIVDEASLASTPTLDTLIGQANAAGAKLLLVGDQHQLSPVEAGGAFGLLATDAPAVELRSLWRFRNRWEADTSRLLRRGDPQAWELYSHHGRLHDGPLESMTEQAYRAWQHAADTGATAVLLACDTTTVTALNSQARADRITAGTVEADGVRLHDDSLAGSGDTIVTRRNARTLRTRTGRWVRNGDLWTITAHHPDGSLTATRIPPGRPSRAARAEETVQLPAGYVREHVELGYATTVHRAQGITVEHSYTVLRAGMSREAAYVALTRGRTANHAYLATDLPDPEHDGAPEPQPAAREILDRILATSHAQTSATQTLRDLQSYATSLARLGPIHETFAQAACTDRYRTLIHSALGRPAADELSDSAAFPPLIAALRRIEYDGHDLAAVLGACVAERPLDAGDAARDLAAVLHWRVERWHRNTAPTRHFDRQLAGGLLTPAPTEYMDPQTGPTLRELEELIQQRVNALTEAALARPPRWLLRLGPPPPGDDDRAAWRRHLQTILAFRDLYPPEPSPAPSVIADDTQLRAEALARHASRAMNTLVPTTPHQPQASLVGRRTPATGRVNR